MFRGKNSDKDRQRRPTPRHVLERIHDAREEGVRALNLSMFGLKEVPPEVYLLPKLEKLYLLHNQIKSIPRNIHQLRNLKELDVSYNQIKSVPEALSALARLESLKLAHNQVTFLPRTLPKLRYLQHLDLSHNQIKSLPKSLLSLQSLSNWKPGQYEKGLSLTGNPIDDVPREVYEQGPKAVAEFYRQREEEGTDRLYEAKLLIVGEAGAGKTSLSQKILNPRQVLNSSTTHGIDVRHWTFTHSDNSPFHVNIWDFGGQEIYHATHQFFLSRRSCYVIVIDNRREDDNLRYWLRTLKLLADDSPVVIVKNEKEDRRRDLNEPQLSKEFPQFCGSCATNLANNRGLSFLQEELSRHLRNLPHIGDELPKTWVRVRNRLESDRRNTISLREYLELCRQNGFKQKDNALQLSQYLHDIGVFLHFQKHYLLKHTIILNHSWCTDAVYQVLDNDMVKEHQGRFTDDDLDRIWADEQYLDLRPELLELMINFRLCYRVLNPHNRNYTYIAPQLLDQRQPKYDWDRAQNLVLHYSYQFMPKGILTQLIVALHKLIAINQQTGGQIVWRTGVVIEKHNTRAEIIELHEKREIKVSLRGSHKSDLLANIRAKIEEIHEDFYELDYQELIPCNCQECRAGDEPNTYQLQSLRRRLYKGKPTVECDKSYEDVNVRSLIDDSIGFHLLDHPGLAESQAGNPKSCQDMTININTVQVSESSQGDNIQQNHSGSGDNVGRDSYVQ